MTDAPHDFKVGDKVFRYNEDDTVGTVVVVHGDQIGATFADALGVYSPKSLTKIAVATSAVEEIQQRLAMAGQRREDARLNAYRNRDDENYDNGLIDGFSRALQILEKWEAESHI
jgi:hypothetical protein